MKFFKVYNFNNTINGQDFSHLQGLLTIYQRISCVPGMNHLYKTELPVLDYFLNIMTKYTCTEIRIPVTFFSAIYIKIK